MLSKLRNIHQRIVYILYWWDDTWVVIGRRCSLTARRFYVPMFSICVLLLPAWVSSWGSAFLPHTKHLQYTWMFVFMCRPCGWLVPSSGCTQPLSQCHQLPTTPQQVERCGGWMDGADAWMRHLRHSGALNNTQVPGSLPMMQAPSFTAPWTSSDACDHVRHLWYGTGNRKDIWWPTCSKRDALYVRTPLWTPGTPHSFQHTNFKNWLFTYCLIYPNSTSARTAFDLCIQYLHSTVRQGESNRGYCVVVIKDGHRVAVLPK